jgi:hypothetical protein
MVYAIVVVVHFRLSALYSAADELSLLAWWQVLKSQSQSAFARFAKIVSGLNRVA